RSLDCLDAVLVPGKDHTDPEADQLGGEGRKLVRLPTRTPELDHEILAHDEALIPEPRGEGAVERVRIGAERRCSAIQEADARGLPGLLRLDGWPRDEEAEKAQNPCASFDH